MFILAKRGDDGWRRMTKTLMPQGGRGSKKGMGSSGHCSSNGVQVAITIAAKYHASRPEVLHRKTKGIKFNGTTIVTSELSNRKKVANYGWNDKDVVQCEFRCRSVEG